MYRIKSKFKQKHQCLSCLLLFLFYEQVFRVASLHDATHFLEHFPHRAIRLISAKRILQGSLILPLIPFTTLCFFTLWVTRAKQCVCCSEVTWSQGVSQRFTSTSNMSSGLTWPLPACPRQGLVFPEPMPVLVFAGYTDTPRESLAVHLHPCLLFLSCWVLCGIFFSFFVGFGCLVVCMCVK